jgi:hypothetical protein
LILNSNDLREPQMVILWRLIYSFQNPNCNWRIQVSVFSSFFIINERKCFLNNELISDFLKLPVVNLGKN